MNSLLSNNPSPSRPQLNGLGFAVSAVLVPGLLYWIAVFPFRIYHRPDFVSTVWPVLQTMLPVCLLLCLVSASFAAYAIWCCWLERSAINAFVIGLWTLSTVVYASIPLHWFWVAGAGA